MIKYTIENIIGCAPPFFLLESHTKGLLVLLHPSHTDHSEPKRRILSFKVTPCNERVLCVYTPSGESTRKQLTRGRLFEELQNYMKKIKELKTI